MGTAVGVAVGVKVGRCVGGCVAGTLTDDPDGAVVAAALAWLTATDMTMMSMIAKMTPRAIHNYIHIIDKFCLISIRYKVIIMTGVSGVP